MQKQIVLEKGNIEYTLRKSRRTRRVRLAVYCGGTVVVTMPWGFRETAVERLIHEKSEWLFSKIAFFRQFAGERLPRSTKREFLQHREAAYALALERIDHFNAHYQFSLNRITIRNQKTRWGSCSKQGNLSFNYKIALLPARLADYIIAHELCHLGVFNHSENFWTLVTETIPNHREIRRELKRSRVNFH